MDAMLYGCFKSFRQNKSIAFDTLFLLYYCVHIYREDLLWKISFQHFETFCKMRGVYSGWYDHRMIFGLDSMSLRSPNCTHVAKDVTAHDRRVSWPVSFLLGEFGTLSIIAKRGWFARESWCELGHGLVQDWMKQKGILSAKLLIQMFLQCFEVKRNISMATLVTGCSDWGTKPEATDVLGQANSYWLLRSPRCLDAGEM